MALIDKDQIRAEIERRRKETTDTFVEQRKLHGEETIYWQGQKDAYGEFLAFLDTLPEQPEVDLKKEVTKFVLSKEYIEGKEPPVLLTARHFYELGLNSKK